MVRSLVANDPHRLKALKGPDQRLNPHQLSCELSELPGYARTLEASRALAVDLFSGAGGLSLGLHRAGFEVILACDIRPDSIATHRHHFAGCSHQCDLSRPDVLEEISRTLNACGDIALIAGGPPCQPFSRNIRWRKHDEGVIDQHRQLNEGRRELWESFLTVIEEVMPRAFLMENVLILHSPVIRKSSAESSARLKPLVIGYMHGSCMRGNTGFLSSALDCSLPGRGSVTHLLCSGRNLSAKPLRRQSHWRQPSRIFPSCLATGGSNGESTLPTPAHGRPISS